MKIISKKNLQFFVHERILDSSKLATLQSRLVKNCYPKFPKSLKTAKFVFSVGLRFFLIQLLFLYFSTDVFAHKVSVYAYREGDKVIGECYFVDGLPCKNSKVEVYDSKGKKVTETMTDEKGRFSFKTSEIGELKIVIPAGEGHRAEYRLEAVEKPEKKEVKRQETVKEAQKQQSPQTSINKDKEEIKQIIDEAMDVKLQGIRK